MATFADIQIRFGANLKQFSTQMQNAQRTMAKLQKQFTNVGKNLTVGITAPITALGVTAVKTFADFEDQMAKVKAISGATAQEFKLLEQNAKQLGATTRFTASRWVNCN